MAEAKRISGLEDHLGYWLRYVSNHVSQAFSRRVEATGVTVAEWVVLRELYDHECLAPSVLAAKLGMTRSAISKLADRLAGKSLVGRQADAKDRRQQTLRLTRQARALVPKLAALADANDAQFFGDLTPAERRRIEAVMKEIVQRSGLREVPLT